MILLPTLLVTRWQSVSHDAERRRNAASGLLPVANKEDQTLRMIAQMASRRFATIAEEGVTGHEVAASPDGTRAFVPISELSE